MAAGVPGWIRAGHATHVSPAYVSTANIVLIDLRPAAQDIPRIPGSVSIPLARLESTLDQIPTAAPIVLYGSSDAQARQGMEILRQNGLNKVSLLEGGLKGWIRDGGNVVRGKPDTRIRWQRHAAAGEVPVAEFRRAMAAGTGPLLLDVRTSKETEAGILPDARHIPLDRLAARMGELPRDRTIFVYSASGPRAAMARSMLVDKGFHALYLAARVRCARGRCEIAE